MRKFNIGDVVQFNEPGNEQFHGSVGVVVEVNTSANGSHYISIVDRSNQSWASVAENRFTLVSFAEPKPVMEQGALEYEEAMAGAELLSGGQVLR